MNDPWRNWTRTKRALERTYFADRTLPSAYLLCGLQEMYERCGDIIASKGIGFDSIDRAAANEVWYHHTRGRTFRRPEAALYACWQKLVQERPEKLLEPARTTTRAPLPARNDAAARGPIAPMMDAIAQEQERVRASRELARATREVSRTL